jgi:predicted peroxiredoxin
MPQPGVTPLKETLDAADTTQVNPLEPLAKLINDFMARGGTIWACTPSVKSRGYGEGDLLDGVVVTGASVMHEQSGGRHT